MHLVFWFQTLYLKNLSPRVTEEDLVSLFVHFQKHDTAPVIVKLLHGRMKGQAFVTFDCTCTYHGCKVLCAGFFEPFQPWEQAWLSAGVKMEHPLPCESRLTTKGWRLDGFLFLWFHYLFIWHCCVGNRNNVCCVKSCLTWTNSTSSVRLRQWTHLLSDLGSFPAESWASRRAFG